MPKILTDADRLQKRQAILDAAAAEIARYGYDRANINTIAEHAGIGRGTIYLYFTSKEEVLAALLDAVGAMIDQAIAGCLLTETTWEQKVNALACTFAQLALDHPDFFRVHVSALYGVNRDIGQPVARWLRISAERLTDALTAAATRGDIRPYDIPTLALTLLGMLESLALLPQVLDLPDTLALSRAEVLAQFIWQGMAPPAPRRS